jgi:hypothetical protein
MIFAACRLMAGWERDMAATGSVNEGLRKLKFMGHYRKPVKTSFAGTEPGRPAKSKSHPDLGALLASLMPDQDMRKKYKLVARTPQEKQKKPATRAFGPLKRFDEELVNVTVTAWICAVKCETAAAAKAGGSAGKAKGGDNDFHVILSSSANVAGQDTRFMTSEVSGLPTGGASLAKLQAARNAIIDMFPAKKLGSRFFKPPKPIKVRVTGSLFFDGDHKAGEVGLVGMKSGRVWEIHPVASISAA